MSKSLEELKADKTHMQKEIARLLFNFEKKYQIQTRRITTLVKNHSEVPNFASVCDVEIELII